ncbi:MAG: tRNA cyclic N6-threonylcarbamoyladenosine(37) synthase TcdA [Rhodocyclaceae bacterium]
MAHPVEDGGAVGESAMAAAAEEPDLGRRFGGISRLYGDEALERFARARVCVVGLGGVGSWAAEALARSGIGAFTLIDLDHVAESNTNRQIHALEGEYGKPKVGAMAARLRAIRPGCRISEIEEFVAPDNAAALIGADHAFVIDAVDSVRAKVALVLHCRAACIPLVCSGGAGGRTDPTRIRVRDLACTEQEPLLAKVRRRLRREHGFPRGAKSRFGIEAVFSDEPMRAAEGCDTAAGLACAGLGSSVCVTAAFGLAAASRVLARLASA